MNKLKIPSIANPKWVYLATLIAFLLLMLESYINYTRVPERENFETLVMIFVCSPLLVLSFMLFEIPGKSKSIALYANGLYFIHALMLILLNTYFHLSNLKTALLTLVLSVIASALLIQLNKKLKYIL